MTDEIFVFSRRYSEDAEHVSVVLRACRSREHASPTRVPSRTLCAACALPGSLAGVAYPQLHYISIVGPGVCNVYEAPTMHLSNGPVLVYTQR
jgi:hypothetical protein